MRKIEREMVNALRERKDWAKDNTSVRWGTDYRGEAEAHVYLHGNLIARYWPDVSELVVDHCGWETVTTKSRLNAILSAFSNGASIYQKNFDWYISMGHAVEGVRFYGGAWLRTR